jgi:hypothetical protein
MHVGFCLPLTSAPQLTRSSWPAPGRTNIGDAGAKALCDALQSNHTLSYIDVSANELMDKSWQKLLVNMMKGKGSMAQQGRM